MSENPARRRTAGVPRLPSLRGGASEQALRRRYAKNRKAGRAGSSVLEYHRAAIAHITARQTGHKPIPEQTAARWIRNHEKAIRDHLAGRDALKPAVRVVPPIVRRAQREDRKRNRGAPW